MAKAPKKADKPAFTGDPLKKSAYATSMASRWIIADALMGGSEAMRNMGEEVLPKHQNESDSVYKKRVARSFLLPVFAQAVKNLTDIVFGDPLDWNEKIGDDIEKWLSAVDLEGNPIDLFAKRGFSLSLAKGEVYIIADEAQVTPEANGNVITLADKRRQGVKPYLGLISADNMLAFEVGKDSGCTYARWRESEDRSVGDFEEEHIERVVEWRPGVWRKFERVGDGKWSMTSGALNFKRDGKSVLPIVRFRIGDIDSAGAMLPPLHGLAEKNVEHFQSSSDQRAILTVGRFPMLGGSGVDEAELQGSQDGTIKVGPNVTLFAKDAQSKFYYVEPEGKSIELGAKDIERLETDMAQLAYQPLMRQSAGVTATKDAIAESKANCSLAAWSIDYCLVLDRAVAMLSLWSGAVAPETSFSLPVEFGIDVIDATQVKSVQDMRAAGDISRAQYLKQMQRLRVLDDEFDMEANEAELESEGPALVDPDVDEPPEPEPEPAPAPPKRVMQ